MRRLRDLASSDVAGIHRLKLAKARRHQMLGRDALAIRYLTTAMARADESSQFD